MGLLDSYPDQVVTIDIFHVNQPPTISLNGEIISGQENPTVLSTSRNNDGKLTKRMNVSVADSDARGLQIRVSVSTDRGFFRDLQQVLAHGQVTVVSAPADNTAATFMCRVQRCNDVTQNLLVETGGSALVPIRANDTGITGQSEVNVGAAVGGAAGGVVAVGAVASLAAAGIAWLVGHSTNMLDEAPVPFDDDGMGAGVTDSPAYAAGSYGGQSPIAVSKAEMMGGGEL